MFKITLGILLGLFLESKFKLWEKVSAFFVSMYNKVKNLFKK